MIRVLHVIKNLGLGGAEINLLNLAAAFDPAKVETHVAYSAGGEIESRFFSAHARLFRYAEDNHKIKSAATPVIVARLAGYARSQRIRIIHTHNFNAHVWGALAAKLSGRKLVEHVHDYRYLDPEEFRRRKGYVDQYRYIRFFKRWSDRVVVLTRQNEQFLLQNGYYPAERIRRIPNGIYPSTKEAARADVRAKLGIPAESLVILTPARFSPEKNIGRVLDVAAATTGEAPQARFIIAGEGPLYGEIEQRIRKEGLGSRVLLTGFYERMDELLAITDVFLLPSFLELHSIALLEALGMGVPVVVSRDVGSNGDFLVHGKNALLCDPFSAEGWAEEVLKLLKDPLLRKSVGQAGQQICRGEFNIRDTAKKFEEMYAELSAR